MEELFSRQVQGLISMFVCSMFFDQQLAATKAKDRGPSTQSLMQHPWVKTIVPFCLLFTVHPPKKCFAICFDPSPF